VCVCLGTEQLWPLLILVEVGPALVSLLILPLLPETPRYLLLVRQNREAARKGLVMLLLWLPGLNPRQLRVEGSTFIEKS